MSEKPQDEQLSGKGVCDELSEPHEMGAGAGGKSCVNPRPAQPQAPAPSLDARRLKAQRMAEAFKDKWRSRWQQVDYADLAEAFAEALAAPSAPSDALREAWIKGCLAGRGEAADICDMMADATPPHNETRRLQASNCAHEIRSLPAPTAPKEPQR